MNKKLKIAFILVLLLVSIVLTGCDPRIIGDVPAIDSVKDFTGETLPLKVAELPLMELSSIDNFQRYKSFVDRSNNLINILNEQGDLFDITLFNPTQEGWNKASRFITEYGPLIDNYNDVVSSAKNFEENKSKETLKKFYFASGAFAFEASLIVGAVYYTAAYQGVGIVYRSVGLNRLALKCGSCIRVILSNAHWFVRGVLVEGTSQLAQVIIEKVTEMYEKVEAWNA